jgi:serine/threonine protein kinase
LARIAARELLHDLRTLPNNDVRRSLPWEQDLVDLAPELGTRGDVEEKLLDIVRSLPPALRPALSKVMLRLALLPARSASVAPSPTGPAAPLPDWLPRNRQLGAFHVLSRIGGGGAGSVFDAIRESDRTRYRRDPSGVEHFALKTPDYDPLAARSLSEEDFMRLFRDEAGALLTLPEHPSLAKLISFDLLSKPKPILVMELVEGFRIDQLIVSTQLDLRAALRVVQDLLSAVVELHRAGIGHLDIKPSNLIRRPNGITVLVDFGLAGRRLRFGCCSPGYASPEVWGIDELVPFGSPETADIYSLGCTAFEILTGEALFDTGSEFTAVSSHLAHDGMPPRLAEAHGRGEIPSELCAWLTGCLRQRGIDRLTAEQAQSAFQGVANILQSAGRTWPLGSPSFE